MKKIAIVTALIGALLLTGAGIKTVQDSSSLKKIESSIKSKAKAIGLPEPAAGKVTLGYVAIGAGALLFVGAFFISQFLLFGALLFLALAAGVYFLNIGSPYFSIPLMAAALVLLFIRKKLV